jgi:hypothetical protein
MVVMVLMIVALANVAAGVPLQLGRTFQAGNWSGV